MNARILNRDFQHPDDGWYMIEPMGEHANRRSGVVQVIDAEAAAAIARTFNRAAAEPGFAGMLIDHEHFKHDQDKETRAYGWLMSLTNRADGIYGQVRWTTTGRAAVDGGDYRFFSTEYDAKDLAVVNRGDTGTYVRPLRLDGLTLTNEPNNKGGKPITNRFRRGSELSAGSAEKPGQKTHNRESERMKTVATKLGLSADASEEAVLVEVTKIMNRATEAEGKVAPLGARVTALETENKQLVEEQVDGILSAAGVKTEKVINRIKPVLVTLKNRAEREEFVRDLGGEKSATAIGTVLNRSQAGTPNAAAASAAAEDNGQELASRAEAEVQQFRIVNRCSYEEARNTVRRMKPELFGLKK